MALSITAADVDVYNNAQVATGPAGTSITAGQVLYYDTTSNTYMLAISGASQLAATVAGIALNNASIGQPVTLQFSGQITIGATVITGQGYYLDTATPGGINEDPTTPSSGDYPAFIGMATSESVIAIGIINNDGIAA